MADRGAERARRERCCHVDVVCVAELALRANVASRPVGNQRPGVAVAGGAEALQAGDVSRQVFCVTLPADLFDHHPEEVVGRVVVPVLGAGGEVKRLLLEGRDEGVVRKR